MAHSLQAPTGLRDFYPADLLRRRYIEKLWRDTAIRHGFEEIDGPTFEHAELYKIKSGEGILNEMFGVFSGKDESQRAALASGEAPYALRPEFTPTLARLYAAKANSLPKPCKWFWQQNCYRAEKPQRGRLREFMQWNCDIIGASDTSPRPANPETWDEAAAPSLRANAEMDAEAVACAAAVLSVAGLSKEAAAVKLSDRTVVSSILRSLSVAPDRYAEAFAVLDRAGKLTPDEMEDATSSLGFSYEGYSEEARWAEQDFDMGVLSFSAGSGTPDLLAFPGEERKPLPMGSLKINLMPLQLLKKQLHSLDMHSWCKADLTLARGLAYYTGMVFEVLADGERAVAGGGRYDNLIELFGGPPTPAVGFGMGDVVLSLLLQDKGLMPEGKDLLEALSAPAASFRPDAFVISNGTPEADAQVRPLVAKLRRGTESAAWLAKEARKPWEAARYRADAIEGKADAAVDERDPAARPLHARHTYKTTKNVGKLLKEASDQHARAAVIIESGSHATVRNLETREEMKDVPLERVARVLAGG